MLCGCATLRPCKKPLSAFFSKLCPQTFLVLQYGSFFLSYTFFGLMYATGQFPILLRDGLPLEGLQFALLMYAILSVIFIGLSIRMNFALTCLFTSIALAYFCLAIGLTHDERRVSKVWPLHHTPVELGVPHSTGLCS